MFSNTRILLKSPILALDAKATVGVIDVSVMWLNPYEMSCLGFDAAEHKREEERTKRTLELAALA